MIENKYILVLKHISTCESNLMSHFWEIESQSCIILLYYYHYHYHCFCKYHLFFIFFFFFCCNCCICFVILPIECWYYCINKNDIDYSVLNIFAKIQCNALYVLSIDHNIQSSVRCLMNITCLIHIFNYNQHMCNITKLKHSNT